MDDQAAHRVGLGGGLRRVYGDDVAALRWLIVVALWALLIGLILGAWGIRFPESRGLIF